MTSTIGLELEWADVDRSLPIPEHLGKWSTEDYSIVNSDGHANCPTGTNWRWGGEINTSPREYPWEQARIVIDLREYLRPTINFKCNLHVHVRDERFPEMMKRVDLLKRFARYLRDAEPFVYSVVEILTPPQRDEFETEDEFRGAKKRYRRNLDSHQHRLSDERFAEMMMASTPQEFKDAHAPPTSSGGRAWNIAKRPGMNMRSLWKHGTIEYRHFPGTDNAIEIECAAKWCKNFTEAATRHAFGQTRAEPQEIFESGRPWYFPQFRPYDHRLMLGFNATKHGG